MIQNKYQKKCINCTKNIGTIFDHNTKLWYDAECWDALQRFIKGE